MLSYAPRDFLKHMSIRSDAPRHFCPACSQDTKTPRIQP